MLVQLRVKITGTRDGMPWPNPGEVIDVPADEAADLIAARIAVAVERSAPEAAVAPAAETAAAPKPRARARKSED